MKKNLLLGLASILIIGNTFAATPEKCMQSAPPILLAYGAATGELPESNQTEWLAVGDTTGEELLGTSLCASTEMALYPNDPAYGWLGPQYPGVADNPILDSTPSNNKNCFCRLLTPVVSRWISLGYIWSGGAVDTTFSGSSSSQDCAANCARGCARYSNHTNRDEAFFTTGLMSD